MHRNEALYQAMVEIRRSNRAQPHVNKSKYNRKVKHVGRDSHNDW